MTPTSPARRSSLLLGIVLTFVMAFMPGTSARQGHALPTEVAVGLPTGNSLWEIVSRQELPIAGDLVTLSPDGQWIAGLGDAGTACVWNVTSGEAQCDPDHTDIDPESIAWAPDSSAIAYTISSMLLRDSDVLVLSAGEGPAVNLTDDVYTGSIVPVGDNVPASLPVDRFPTWSSDSRTIAFARSDMVASTAATTLMTIDRAGGAPTVLHTAHPTASLAIATKLLAAPDGSWLYAIHADDPSDDTNGIWRLAPDGTADHLLPGGPLEAFPQPALTDLRVTDAGMFISGYALGRVSSISASSPVAFELALETGEVLPLGDEVTRVTPYSYSPDGQSWIAEVSPNPIWSLVISDHQGGLLELGMASESPWIYSRGVEWAANNTVLLTTGRSGGLLLTLQVGAP